MGEFRVGVKSLIIYNRKTLLIKRVSAEGGTWEFPGGLMEFGEDLHNALRREIKEETGLEDISVGRLIYAMTAKVNPERQVVGLGYISYANSDKVTLSPSEHTDYIWADKEQTLHLLNNDMLDLLRENNILDTLEID